MRGNFCLLPLADGGVVVLREGVLLGSTTFAFQLLAFHPLAGIMTLTNAVVDITGDNRPDVLATNYGFTATASVLPGTLQTAATFNVGPADTRPNCVATADLNADGCPDLLTANSGPNTLNVLLNTTSLAARPARRAGMAAPQPSYYCRHYSETNQPTCCRAAGADYYA